MSLSFYYEFGAPAETTAEELERFLLGVESLAKSLGFHPTIVLNAKFDTDERREFSRRLGAGFVLEDERLKGVAIPAENQVSEHDPVNGECRLYPESGVVLVATDEDAAESCFGFFKFSARVVDIHGETLAETGLQGRWYFRDFVDSPDPRFREIVALFVNAGFAQKIKDEFV